MAAVTFAAPAQAFELPARDFATWHEYAPASAGGHPSVLAVDQGDAVWYTDPLNNEVVQVPFATPTSPRAFSLGPTGPGISSMVTLPDGTLWFSDFANAAIGRLDPSTGTVDSFPLLGAFDTATSLVVGPGGAVWFGDPANGGLGAIGPDGHITRIAEPTGVEIKNLVYAADGRLWYTKNTGAELGAYDPATGLFDSFPVPIGSFTDLAVSKTGDLWVGGVDALIRVRLDGTIASRVILPTSPAGYSTPMQLVAGVDYELHFTDFQMGLGTVDAAGRVTYSRPPFALSAPDALTITSTGSLWYTDPPRDSLGNI
ncbi:hypothetical protein SCB71_03100 [Herbiconiux sp. KACC 21604]|uniref:Vgb family protein n=1 Tax=unclassified Herbiconiux TaxID=2618217 RepID=UPI0014916DD2|nr:hypothetical protein [Herbiconiux sp. SALV-R1]QJU52381.1 hypothetical protein HL652_01070 [Herbiconiux sp. SALV-R1]WPO87243.1 hypothetical protein SCB71_03100 [Herbiconiux sp. KACC 21604]